MSKPSTTRVKSRHLQEGDVPPEAPGESLFLTSPSFWEQPTFLGLWLHHLDLCRCGQAVFSSICAGSLSASQLQGCMCCI